MCVCPECFTLTGLLRFVICHMRNLCIIFVTLKIHLQTIVNTILANLYCNLLINEEIMKRTRHSDCENVVVGRFQKCCKAFEK